MIRLGKWASLFVRDGESFPAFEVFGVAGSWFDQVPGFDHIVVRVEVSGVADAHVFKEPSVCTQDVVTG